MKCPKCGKELKKNQWNGYECKKECGFRIYNPTFGRKMTDEELEVLLKDKKTPYLNGFVNKDGKEFSARLKLDEEYKIVPYWEAGDGQDNSLKCPKCGKPIRKNSKAWGCSGWKEGCDFTIWNTVAGHILTDKEKEDLINKGATSLIKGFKSKAGKEFEAKLKFDENHKVIFEFEQKEEPKVENKVEDEPEPPEDPFGEDIY